jgi:putative membrane protein
VPLPFRENRFLQALCLIMAAVLLITGTHPEKVFDWWLENLLAMTFMVILGFTYKRLALSQTSYILILIFLSFHEWGAQYKYSDVPLGEWMKPLLGSTRNHYDRVIHFGYGFMLAYPMQEWFMRSAGVWTKWSYLFPIQFTMACSAVYEIMEAFMATVLSPERGEEFVGMQGDIWDAQKDMFMAGIGAVLAMAIVAAVRYRRAQQAALAASVVPVLVAKSTYAGRV